MRAYRAYKPPNAARSPSRAASTSEPSSELWGVGEVLTARQSLIVRRESTRLPPSKLPTPEIISVSKTPQSVRALTKDRRKVSETRIPSAAGNNDSLLILGGFPLTRAKIRLYPQTGVQHLIRSKLVAYQRGLWRFKTMATINQIADSARAAAGREEMQIGRSGQSVLELIGNTPLLRLTRIGSEFPNVEFCAKAEWFNPGGSVKDRPALSMIKAGLASGALR